MSRQASRKNMESRVSSLETRIEEVQQSQKEVQAKLELIMGQLQARMARGNGGSLGDSTATPTHQPFINSTSPLSLEKSNEIVLKLQSFHKEKVRAREKRDKFWSQFRPRYKPKTRPCLRPILKKFKKVRDYGKNHDDDSATFRSNPKFQDSFGVFRTTLARENENVFDLFVKEAKNSVEIPPFLDSDCKKDTANDLVSGLPILELLEKKDEFPSSRLILENKVGFQLIVSVGTIKGLQSLKNLDQEALTQIGFIGLDNCFTYESSGSHILQLFEEMSHSCGFCNGDSFVLVIQFGYHKGIRDKDGGLSKDKIWEDHSIIFRYEIGTILISSCTNESENATAYNKDGTVCLSEFNSMDFLAICELGFVLNAEKRNFLEDADPFIVPAEKTRLALNVFDEIPDSSCRVVVNYDMFYCKGIRDKGGGSKFKEPQLRSVASELLQHPFITRQSMEPDPVFCTSVMEDSELRSPSYSPHLHTFEMSTCPDSDDMCNLGSLQHSTIHPNKLLESRAIWGRNNNDDDMCQIDDKDDTMVGKVKLSSSLMPDNIKSFNPMCEPTDDELMCKFGGSLETEFFCRQSGTIGTGEKDFSFPCGTSLVEGNNSIVNSWKMRIKIMLDAAKGIEYLHNYAVSMGVVEYAGQRIVAGELQSMLDQRVGKPDPKEGEAVELVAYTTISGITNKCPSKNKSNADNFVLYTVESMKGSLGVTMEIKVEVIKEVDRAVSGLGTTFYVSMDGQIYDHWSFPRASYDMNIIVVVMAEMEKFMKVTAWEFMVDSLVLPLGECDVTIGAQWLYTFEPVFRGFQEYSHGFAGWMDIVEHLFADMHFKKLISQRSFGLVPSSTCKG